MSVLWSNSAVSFKIIHTPIILLEMFDPLPLKQQQGKFFKEQKLVQSKKVGHNIQQGLIRSKNGGMLEFTLRSLSKLSHLPHPLPTKKRHVSFQIE